MTDALITNPIENLTRLWIGAGTKFTDSALGEPNTVLALAVIIATIVGVILVKFAYNESQK